MGARYEVRLAGEGGQGLALPIPQPRRAIFTGGDDVFPIGAEGGVIDPVLMAAESGQGVPLNIPQPCCAIPTGGEDVLPIGAESGVCDSVCMAPQGLAKLAGHSKPQCAISLNCVGPVNLIGHGDRLYSQ